MKTINKRKWLNELSNHNMGHLYWSWAIPTDEDKHYESHEFSFVLFDCSRSTSLDIGCYTEKERRNSIKKLRIIQNACSDLISVLKDAETDKARRARLTPKKEKDND